MMIESMSYSHCKKIIMISSLNMFFTAGFFFKKIFYLFILFIFKARGREGEREGAKHQCVVASYMPPTRDLACNPGMCPAWEVNQRPFGSQASAQSTEPHQPGNTAGFLIRLENVFWSKFIKDGNPVAQWQHVCLQIKFIKDVYCEWVAFDHVLCAFITSVQVYNDTVISS